MQYIQPFNIDLNVKYIETKYIKKTAERTLAYIEAGFPIHLRGAAGVGKTSLAFHIANKIGRPIIFMCGSEDFSSINLVGEYRGNKKTLVVDNYISSVFKRDEEERKLWIDGRLATACKNGYTIIYDEFTRAKPEVNNVLLSVLEEKMIDTPSTNSPNSYIKINPDFRIIFTSNPDEYVGVYTSTNALIDRMITIDMDEMDEETEIQIIISKSQIKLTDAKKLVQITHYIRSHTKDKNWLSMRCSIMLAKVVKSMNIKVDSHDTMFRQVCRDIYNSAFITTGVTVEEKSKYGDLVDIALSSVLDIK